MKSLNSSILDNLKNLHISLDNIFNTCYGLVEQVNPHTHQLKLCDFGSAKVLVSFSKPKFFHVI